jgi:two-component system, chemotaxis family, chemotaxis protein CheY
MSIPTSALIIDDEKHIRVYLKMLLKKLGVATTQEASNIEEARLQLAASKPELVTLDLNMPGGSGLDFLREIREQDQDTYVVIMSADALTATIRAANEAGADGFIRKDLPPQQMLEELHKIFTDEPPEEGTNADKAPVG